jgi:hypothetical protein
LIIGAVIAYFLFDEQRRDDLLDRLTGASGPIEQTVQNYAQPVTNQAQQAAEGATAQTQDVAQQAEQVAKEAEQKSGQ